MGGNKHIRCCMGSTQQQGGSRTSPQGLSADHGAISLRAGASFSEMEVRMLAGKRTQRERMTLGEHLPNSCLCSRWRGGWSCPVMPAQSSVTETLPQAALSPLPGGSV